MQGQFLTGETIGDFQEHLVLEEKSGATVEKYLRDVKAFAAFVNGAAVTKEVVIEYKRQLQAAYAVRSVNSMLASINSLFAFLGWHEVKVKSIKLQQQIYCPEEKELTKAEYTRLCRAAEKKHNERLNLILQTIGGTGIRVSELQYITVEAAKHGEATVSCKAKTRSVFIVKELQKKIAPLCSGARDKKRYDFCDTNRKADEPHQHLAGNEKPLYRSRRQSAEGLSA